MHSYADRALLVPGQSVLSVSMDLVYSDRVVSRQLVSKCGHVTIL